DVEVHRYIFYDFVILYCDVLLDVCRYIVNREVQSLEKTARFWLHGGSAGVTERQAQMELVNNLVTRRSGAKRMKIDPDYWPELLELLLRLLERPREASKLLRLGEVILFEHVLGERT